MNKTTKLYLCAAIAGAGLALSPIAVQGQTSTGTANARDTTTGNIGTDTRNDRNDDHDYGWIGLAGLLGLAGLMRRDRNERHDTTSGTRRSEFAGTRS